MICMTALLHAMVSAVWSPLAAEHTCDGLGAAYKQTLRMQTNLKDADRLLRMQGMDAGDAACD